MPFANLDRILRRLVLEVYVIVLALGVTSQLAWINSAGLAPKSERILFIGLHVGVFCGIYVFLVYDWIVLSTLLDKVGYLKHVGTKPSISFPRFFIDCAALGVKSGIIFIVCGDYSEVSFLGILALLAVWHGFIVGWHCTARNAFKFYRAHLVMALVYLVIVAAMTTVKPLLPWLHDRRVVDGMFSGLAVWLTVFSLLRLRIQIARFYDPLAAPSEPRPQEQ
jgi:hypothetical protein